MHNFNDAFILAQFPQDPDLCYLNHAAVSPWPKCTEEAITQFAKENVYQGARDYPKWMEKEKSLRSLLAQLLNVEGSSEIALAKSTSEALSTIAYGIHWKEGDEIIISNEEFPSNRIVWESLANQGVRLVIADIASESPLNAIAACVTEHTRLLSISSVQYASGRKVDLVKLGQLCRQHDILFCVDAIQSLGTIPFNQRAIGADFVVADGHKWMMASEGLALLYIQQKHIETLKLHQFGWHMVAACGQYDKLDWCPANNATRFECGSPNMLGIHALNASLGFLLDIGIEKIEIALQTRIEHLIKRLKELPNMTILSPLATEDRAGIVTFKPDKANLETLYRTLMKEGVICAQRGGGIRFSPAFYTPLEVIDEAVSRLKRHI